MSRWLLLLVPLAAWAHAANVATWTVEQAPDGWLLRATLPTAGLTQAMHARRGPGPHALEVWEAEAEALARAGVALRCGGEPTPLGPGAVRLGQHTSELLFELPRPCPELAGTRLDALREVPGQHNVLRLQDAKGLSQWVLAGRNGFTLTAEVPASKGSTSR
jgi:hypothetical protein